MKYDTLTNKSYQMTADIWQLFQQDENSAAPLYNFARPIKCNIVFNSGRTILYTDDPNVNVENQIRNIRDYNGALVTDDMYLVKSTIPVVNNFGFVEGTSYSLRVTNG